MLYQREEDVIAQLANGLVYYWSVPCETVEPKPMYKEEIVTISIYQNTIVLLTVCGKVLANMICDHIIPGPLNGDTSGGQIVRGSIKIRHREEVDLTSVTRNLIGGQPIYHICAITNTAVVATEHRILVIEMKQYTDWYEENIPIIIFDHTYQSKIISVSADDLGILVRTSNNCLFLIGQHTQECIYDSALDISLDITDAVLASEGIFILTNEETYVISDPKNRPFKLELPDGMTVDKIISFGNLSFFLTQEGECLFNYSNIFKSKGSCIRPWFTITFDDPIQAIYRHENWIVFNSNGKLHHRLIWNLAKDYLPHTHMLFTEEKYVACTILSDTLDYVATTDGRVYEFRTCDKGVSSGSIPFFESNPIAIKGNRAAIRSAGNVIEPLSSII